MIKFSKCASCDNFTYHYLFDEGLFGIMKSTCGQCVYSKRANASKCQFFVKRTNNNIEDESISIMNRLMKLNKQISKQVNEMKLIEKRFKIIEEKTQK